MNEKTTKSFWIVATAIVSTTTLAVFVSGAGRIADLRVPIMLIGTALLGLSSGIAAIIYAGVFVKIRRRRARGATYRQTSRWHLGFWALSFTTFIIGIPVGVGSITLDLATGLVFVLAILLSSGGLWLQHGFIVSGRGGYPGKDERSERVQGKAAVATLFVSLAVIIELLVYNTVLVTSLGLPEVGGTAELLVLIVAITLSYVTLYWHFNGRADL
jgi:hypothetical protein